MKNLIKLLGLLVFASVARAADAPKTWALIVGVGTYENPQISSLRFPAKDALSLRDALVDPKIGALPRNQVKMLADNEATHDNIVGAVASFFKPNVQAGDKVVVFLAGHGVAKGVGVNAKSFLLPTDVKGLTIASLESSAVDLRALADELGALPASQFVVFVDACREDPTPGRGIKGNTLSDVLSRGLTVVPQDEKSQSATFFACSVGQRAYEDANLGHGVFTNWILEGLTQGAVPQKNGDVEMGVLSSYVSQKIAAWAKKTSEGGDFEVEQTPELVTAKPLEQPLVFLQVKRASSAPPMIPTPPKLIVNASPEAAQVSINGERIGSGVVEKDLLQAGEVQVSVSAPGYTPITRSVKVQGGYQNQVAVQLQPAAGATPIAADAPAMKFYQRAAAAEARGQWEVAEQGYSAAIGANPKFLSAHEALLELHRLQGRNADAVADALNMLTNAPGAHSLAVLSRAYSRFAEAGAGNANLTTTMAPVNKYSVPRDAKQALPQALRAAQEAIGADANSAEASRAQGYALAALDAKGKNKTPALAAFGKAVFLDESDAMNQLALGYGIRYYGVQQKDEAARQSEVKRAIATLQQAVKLRPNYYDAHRELAFCHTLLGDMDAALRECDLANANRGAATDVNEIAALDVAAAGMHKKAAENSTGDKKEAHEAASAGYMADAREHDPELKLALSILNTVGVSTSLYSYLPSEVSKWLNPGDAIKGEILNKIPGRGRFPF